VFTTHITGCRRIRRWTNLSINFRRIVASQAEKKSVSAAEAGLVLHQLSYPPGETLKPTKESCTGGTKMSDDDDIKLQTSPSAAVMAETTDHLAKDPEALARSYGPSGFRGVIQSGYVLRCAVFAAMGGFLFGLFSFPSPCGVSG
jgi:hypothetical protein